MNICLKVKLNDKKFTESICNMLHHFLYQDFQKFSYSSQEELNDF
jgi:hypothetical protein